VTVSVRDNPAQNRYEIYDDHQLAGFSQYKLTTDKISFTHTETNAAFTGRGLARTLVAEELDDARKLGLAVLPFCPYVRKVIAAHPEQYLDLVPASDRERFDLPSGGDADGPDVRPIGETEAGR
jgi:predicted GNAT family acetyltransferase